MIDDSVVIELVKGQAQTQQAIRDLSNRLIGGEGQKGVLVAMHEEHKEQFNTITQEHKLIHTRIDGVKDEVDGIQRKAAWYSGVGTTLGVFVGYAVNFMTHRK
jgi:hypothetical protein